jgi:aminopeptidase
MDPRTTKLAEILVNYSIGVQPGEWVVVRGSVGGLPLINEVVRLAIEAGGYVDTIIQDEQIQETHMRHSSDEQLSFISPMMKLMAEKADATIGIQAPANTRNLSGIDPKKQQFAAIARQEMMKVFMERSASGALRWCGTNYPCAAFAQDADMSVSDYADFVYGATFADQDDPVAKWNEIHDMQQVYIDWLKGKEQVEVRGPNIELSLSIKDRTFINSDGKHNMPSGEIFTGPVEDSVNGWVKFTYPAVRGGVEVEGVEFKFVDGKVVDAKATKNEAYLLSQLDSAEGARYLGEFAIGTNYGINKFTKNILFDEKIGGTLHMAVGSGYPETGSKNQAPIHWDFICDMREDSEILVDGELFYKNGQFKI